MIDRRAFTTSGLASLAFGGLAWRAAAQAQEQSYRNEVPGYGPLRPDPEALLDLPAGFSYTIVSSAGEAMDDGYVAPGHFDGMACFPLRGGRVALVRNHELFPDALDKGPTGGLARLEQRLRGEPHFGVDQAGRPLPGGTSTIVYDMRRRRRVSQYLSLAGTVVNCAGGATLWGSWLSCEESVLRRDEAGQDHGWVFEVPAARRGLTSPQPLRAMGRFRHEAAAVDPRSGAVYLTEDQQDGLFYRFLPNRPGRLAEGGRLQALALRDLPGADARNWESEVLTRGRPRAVRWVNLAEVENPDNDLRLRGRAAGAACFARGEGIHAGRKEFYFCCTSGGRARFGQIMRYVPSPHEGRPGEEGSPGTIELFVESSDDKVMDYADNLTVAPWGHLIVCEDRGDGETCHLKGVTPEGRVYTLARLRLDTELAGACFSPDASTLFLNVYDPGRTVAIAGPWRRLLRT